LPDYYVADQQSLDRAIADFDRAIQLKPDYLAAFGGRAAAFGHKGQPDRANRSLGAYHHARP
jgi:hypothetical protein